MMERGREGRTGRKKKSRIEIGNMDVIRQSAVRGLKGGDEFLVSPHQGV